jgi:hypothetical protein
MEDRPTENTQPLKTAMACSSPTFTFPNTVVTRVHGPCNYASLLVANPSPPSPQAMFDQYNLQNFVHNGFDHLKICKGMYGLPQAGLLANNQLGPHLALQGYIQSPHTHGLFIHKTRPITCCHMVDDLVIRYVEHYTVTGVTLLVPSLLYTLSGTISTGTLDISMRSAMELAATNGRLSTLLHWRDRAATKGNMVHQEAGKHFYFKDQRKKAFCKCQPTTFSVVSAKPKTLSPSSR